MITLTYHPLKNPASSKYYDKIGTIGNLESKMNVRDMIGFCKGNILKYKLRDGNKAGTDDKLKAWTYEIYMKVLEQVGNKDSIVSDVIEIEHMETSPHIYCVHEKGTEPELDDNRQYIDSPIYHQNNDREITLVTSSWHERF